MYEIGALKRQLNVSD